MIIIVNSPQVDIKIYLKEKHPPYSVLLSVATDHINIASVDISNDVIPALSQDLVEVCRVNLELHIHR